MILSVKPVQIWQNIFQQLAKMWIFKITKFFFGKFGLSHSIPLFIYNKKESV